MLRRRSLIVFILAVGFSSPPVTAFIPAAPAERLRPQSPFVAGLIADAVKRSPTTRALVERVRAGDVIVYLEARRQLDSSLAACVTWMNAAAGPRYVRVTLRQGLRRTDAMAMLAHELQHVAELIDHPEVRSSADLVALYRTIGHRSAYGDSRWDTKEAVRAELAARQEITAA
jgi:hypothetical protein